MWRSFFLAIGITLCIVGAECLVVDEALLARSLTEPTPAEPATLFGPAEGSPQQFKTREWMPYSFMACGAVIILYTITIPQRLGQG
jgi:hypothetical protein